jgi:hypothetical protein
MFILNRGALLITLHRRKNLLEKNAFLREALLDHTLRVTIQMHGEGSHQVGQKKKKRIQKILPESHFERKTLKVKGLVLYLRPQEQSDPWAEILNALHHAQIVSVEFVLKQDETRIHNGVPMWITHRASRVQ